MRGRCDSCAVSGAAVPNQAKYRCPACSAASCSLACVKAHKAKTSCTGIRNRAAAVPRRAFDEGMLMSDYTLLEEVGRASSSSHRATVESQPLPPSASARSKRAMLAREAAARSVHLHLLPRGFARSRRNSTHTKGRKGLRVMYWHVDVVFVSDGKERRVNVDAAAEMATIEELVRGAKEALLRSRRRRDAARSTSIAAAPMTELAVFILNEHVVGPSSAGPEHVPVATKAIGEDDLHRYLRVDPKDSLATAVANRIIIEFPILYVTMASSTDNTRLTEAKAGLFEKPEPDSDSDSSDCSDEPVPNCPSDSDGEIDESGVGNAPDAELPRNAEPKSRESDASKAAAPPKIDSRGSVKPSSPLPSCAADGRSKPVLPSKRKWEDVDVLEREPSGEEGTDQINSSLTRSSSGHPGDPSVVGGSTPRPIHSDGGLASDVKSVRPGKRICLPSSHGVGIPLAESSTRVQDDDPPIPRLARVPATSA